MDTKLFFYIPALFVLKTGIAYVMTKVLSILIFIFFGHYPASLVQDLTFVYLFVSTEIKVEI